MTEPAYDLVIRGGRVRPPPMCSRPTSRSRARRSSPSGAILARARARSMAAGRLVMPGGVDAHCHIEQLTAAGLVNADDFELATVSAAFGGTTTVIPFAAQQVGNKLRDVVAAYHALATKGAVIDYAFHMIIADPTEETVTSDIPAMVEQGMGSIKIFMTYDRLKVEDEKLLDVLLAARQSGAMVCVHAENHGMLSWMGRRLVEKGYIAPKYHAMAHPRIAETEAFTRLISMAALVDQPIMIFHVSTAEGAAVVRRGAGRGAQGFRRDLSAIPVPHGAGHGQAGTGRRQVDVQPARAGRADQEALWQALALGDLQSRLVGSRPIPLRRDREAACRPLGHVQADRQRHAGAGEPPAVDVRRDGDARAARAEKFVETHRDHTGEDLQSPSAQRLDRDRRRCRYRDLGSRPQGDAERTRMMHDVAGYRPYAGRERAGLADHGALARARDHCRRQALGRTGLRPFPCARRRRGGEADRPTRGGHGSGAEFRGDTAVIGDGSG